VILPPASSTGLTCAVSHTITCGEDILELMALNEICLEGRRLLDSYLMALTNQDAVKVAALSGYVTQKEIRDTQDHLNTARERFWRHLGAHGCRQMEKTSIAQEIPSRSEGQTFSVRYLVPLNSISTVRTKKSR